MARFRLCWKLGICLVEMGKESLECVGFEASVNYGFGNEHLRTRKFGAWGSSPGSSTGRVGAVLSETFPPFSPWVAVRDALFHLRVGQENWEPDYWLRLCMYLELAS